MKPRCVAKEPFSRRKRRGRVQFESLVLLGAVAAAGTSAFHHFGDQVGASIAERTHAASYTPQLGSTSQAIVSGSASALARLVRSAADVATDVANIYDNVPRTLNKIDVGDAWFNALKDDIIPGIKADSITYEQAVARLTQEATGSEDQARVVMSGVFDVYASVGEERFGRNVNLGPSAANATPETAAIYALELAARRDVPSARDLDSAFARIGNSVPADTLERIQAIRRIFNGGIDDDTRTRLFVSSVDPTGSDPRLRRQTMMSFLGRFRAEPNAFGYLVGEEASTVQEVFEQARLINAGYSPDAVTYLQGTLRSRVMEVIDAFEARKAETVPPGELSSIADEVQFTDTAGNPGRILQAESDEVVRFSNELLRTVTVGDFDDADALVRQFDEFLTSRVDELELDLKRRDDLEAAAQAETAEANGTAATASTATADAIEASARLAEEQRTRLRTAIDELRSAAAVAADRIESDRGPLLPVAEELLSPADEVDVGLDLFARAQSRTLDGIPDSYARYVELLSNQTINRADGAVIEPAAGYPADALNKIVREATVRAALAEKDGFDQVPVVEGLGELILDAAKDRELAQALRDDLVAFAERFRNGLEEQRLEKAREAAAPVDSRRPNQPSALEEARRLLDDDATLATFGP